jgi:hypothetical protein
MQATAQGRVLIIPAKPRRSCSLDYSRYQTSTQSHSTFDSVVGIGLNHAPADRLTNITEVNKGDGNSLSGINDIDMSLTKGRDDRSRTAYLVRKRFIGDEKGSIVDKDLMSLIPTYHALI